MRSLRGWPVITLFVTLYAICSQRTGVALLVCAGGQPCASMQAGPARDRQPADKTEPLVGIICPQGNGRLSVQVDSVEPGRLDLEAGTEFEGSVTLGLPGGLMAKANSARVITRFDKEKGEIHVSFLEKRAAVQGARLKPTVTVVSSPTDLGKNITVVADTASRLETGAGNQRRATLESHGTITVKLPSGASIRAHSARFYQVADPKTNQKSLVFEALES